MVFKTAFSALMPVFLCTHLKMSWITLFAWGKKVFATNAISYLYPQIFRNFSEKE